MEVKATVEDKEIVINNQTSVIADHVKKIARLEHELKEQRISIEKLWKENEQNVTKLSKLQDEYNNVVYEWDKSKHTLQSKMTDIKVRCNLESSFSYITLFSNFSLVKKKTTVSRTT